jgi:hypothetical protein
MERRRHNPKLLKSLPRGGSDANLPVLILTKRAVSRRPATCLLRGAKTPLPENYLGLRIPALAIIRWAELCPQLGAEILGANWEHFDRLAVDEMLVGQGRLASSKALRGVWPILRGHRYPSVIGGCSASSRPILDRDEREVRAVTSEGSQRCSSQPAMCCPWLSARTGRACCDWHAGGTADEDEGVRPGSVRDQLPVGLGPVIDGRCVVGKLAAARQQEQATAHHSGTRSVVRTRWTPRRSRP